MAVDKHELYVEAVRTFLEKGLTPEAIHENNADMHAALEQVRKEKGLPPLNICVKCGDGATTTVPRRMPTLL